MNNTASKIIIILGIIIALISAYILLKFELPSKPMAGKGGMEEQQTANIGGDFTLTDQNNNQFNSKQLKGSPALIYFGFTHCPDICPLTLDKLSAVINTLNKYQIKIQPVFITIDPERDRPELLKEYLKHFGDNFIGLTGTNQEVKKVADLYKVYYAQSSSSKGGSDDNYMVDHSSFVYLLDANGSYISHFHGNSTADEIVEYIRINKAKLLD